MLSRRFSDNRFNPDIFQCMRSVVVSTDSSAMDVRESTLPRETKQCSTSIQNPVSTSRSLSVQLLTSKIVLIRSIQDKVITDISCGHQHTIAIDKDG